MKNIIFLGLISCFADISSEMVYPIMPLYLVSEFGATPTLVGIIEGIAESVASLLKVFSGYITDKYRKKKPIAFVGYSTVLFYKIALILSTSWIGILFARVLDRLGKGIRVAPRDVMVSESAEEGKKGLAFGIHKSLDMIGSGGGAFIAFLLLKSSEEISFNQIFLYSIIPAIIALLIFLCVKEKKEHKIKEREKFWENLKNIDSQLKLYLFVVLIFTLGNSSNTFLLLRAKSVGFDNAETVLMYAIYSLSAAIFSIPAGRKSDNIGRKKLLVLGYITFSIVYLGFALADSKSMIVLLFIFYGLYTAMITGVERAYIAEIAPVEIKGTILGLHSTITGLMLFPASTIAGLLWTNFGSMSPFIYGASLSAIAASVLTFFMKDNRKLNF